MDAKKGMTFILLAFVAASIGWLVFKEVGRRKALAKVRATASAAPARGLTKSPAAGPGTPGAPQADPVKPGAPQGGTPQPERKIVVTYFLTNTRCPSCYKIETFTQAAVTGTLAGPVAEKRLVWRTINTDLPENEHFLKDYKLVSKSVVVSEVVGGKEKRWKNLERVWDLLDDPKAFESYIVKEVKAFLGDA